MHRSRQHQAGGTRDVEEGTGLVKRQYNTRSVTRNNGKRSTTTNRLGARYDSVGVPSSSYVGSASAGSSAAAFGIMMVTMGVLVGLLLVVALYVVPNTNGTTNRIETQEYVYNNITRFATYCLTPNNVDPTILAGWML